MLRNSIAFPAAALAIALYTSAASAQGHTHNHPHLHVNPRWDECSFQLNAALTQSALCAY